MSTNPEDTTNVVEHKLVPKLVTTDEGGSETDSQNSSVLPSPRSGASTPPIDSSELSPPSSKSESSVAPNKRKTTKTSNHSRRHSKSTEDSDEASTSTRHRSADRPEPSSKSSSNRNSAPRTTPSTSASSQPQEPKEKSSSGRSGSKTLQAGPSSSSKSSKKGNLSPTSSFNSTTIPEPSPPSSNGSISPRNNNSTNTVASNYLPLTPPSSSSKSQVLTIHLGSGQVHSGILLPERTLKQVLDKLCEHRSDIDPSKSVAKDMDGNLLDIEKTIGELGVTEMAYQVPELSNGSGASFLEDDSQLQLDVIAKDHVLDSVHIDSIEEFVLSGQLMNGDTLETKTDHDNEYTRRKLKALVEKMKSNKSGLIAKTRRMKLRNYENCMVASEIVIWLIDNVHVSQPQAVAIGRALQQEGFINHVTFRSAFSDSKELLFVFSDGVSESSPTSDQSDSSSISSATASSLPPSTGTPSPQNILTQSTLNALSQSFVGASLGDSVSKTSSPDPPHPRIGYAGGHANTTSTASIHARNKSAEDRKMFDDVRMQARCHTAFWNPRPNGVPYSSTTTTIGRNAGAMQGNNLKKSFKKMMYLKTLCSYVPNIVLREFAINNTAIVPPINNQYYACVLFADISGFTPLCEACAKKGARGVEVLTSHLNEYFGRMINLILNHGGDIVKFAGDALVAIFPTSDERALGYSCLLASQCALAMQEHLHQYNADGCLLTLHIGIGAGPITGIVVGGVAGRMEFLIAGQPMDQVAACESAAKSGEVYISYEAASLIKSNIDVSVDITNKKGTKKKKIDLSTILPISTTDSPSSSVSSSGASTPTTGSTIFNLLPLGSSSGSVERPGTPLLPSPSVNSAGSLPTIPSHVSNTPSTAPSSPHTSSHNNSHGEKSSQIFRLDKVVDHIALPASASIPQVKSLKKFISPFIQPAVLGHLNSGSPDHFLAELRNVSVIFVSLALQYSTDVLEKLQQCVVAMQEAVQHYEGTIRQFIIDDKGSVLIAAFGLPPLSHEDDPCRAVQAAMMLQKRVYGELGIETNVGVTTGKAFCGAVGSEERREYAMVGDIVNLSARLMSKADGGILCDRETWQASKSRISFKTLAPINVKGKVAPIEIFAPYSSDAIASVGSTGSSSNITLTGTGSATSSPASSSRNLDALGIGNMASGLTGGNVALLSKISGSRTLGRPGGTRPEFLRNMREHKFFTMRSQNANLIGRSNILSQLNNVVTWLQDPFKNEDPAKFIVIEGDPGMGKSFLLGHFVRTVQRNAAQAMRPLIGSTFSNEANTPYYAWRDILTTLLEIDGLVHFPGSKEEHVTNLLTNKLTNMGFQDLIDYIPLLNSALPLSLEDNEKCRELSGQLRADKLQHLLVKLISTSNCPLIILDNAQWLDSASWRLILAAVMEIKKFAIVCSIRPIEPGSSNLELEQLFALPQDCIIRLKMESLNMEETLQLVEQKLGVKSIPPHVGEVIAEKGGGNPLLISELTEALLAGGQIEVTSSGECRATTKMTRQLSSLGIPNTLRGLITGKVDRLPQNLQMILKAASVIGRVFEVELLQKLCKNLLNVTHADESGFLSDLSSLEQMEFISMKSEEPLTYMFQQLLSQEVIYDLMLFAQRRKIHESIAVEFEENATATLSASSFNQVAVNFPGLAHHYRKANVLDKAAWYYAKSGEQALSNYANREAVAFFNEALELQKSIDGSSSGDNPSSSSSSTSSSSSSSSSASTASLIGNNKVIPQHIFLLLSWKRQLGMAYYNLGLLEKAGHVLESALEAINEPIRIKLGTELLKQLKGKKTNMTLDPHTFKNVRGGSMSQIFAPSTIASANASSKESSGKSKSSAALTGATVAVQVVNREHVLILLALGRVNYYACNLKAMTYCNLTALKKAEEFGVSKERCEAYGGTILTCSIHEKYDLAESYVEIGTTLTNMLSGIDSEPQMNLLHATGTYYCGVQQWQKAEVAFSKVIDMAKSIGNARRFEESAIFLSSCFFLKGKIKESQKLTEEAVASAARRGDAQSQIAAFSAQARNAIALGHTEKALEALTTIEKLVTNTDGYKLDTASEINFHALMALVYLAKKDFELAFRTAETVTKFIETAEPTCFFNFTGYMTVPEVFCLVLQEHNKIHSTFKLRGHNTPTTVLAKIQTALKHLANFAKVFTFAEPRLTLWQGVVESFSGKTDKAVVTYKRSLGVAQKYGMLYDQGLALFRIGKCTDVKDKRDAVEEKLAAYDKALDIFTDIGAVYTELIE